MYKLEAKAEDKGWKPLSRTVEVQIDVVDRANNPPVWDHIVYGPTYCKENVTVGAKVVSVKARSVTLLMLRAALHEPALHAISWQYCSCAR
ncbi:CadN [Anthophora quadrimaculata]